MISKTYKVFITSRQNVPEPHFAIGGDCEGQLFIEEKDRFCSSRASVYLGSKSIANSHIA
ncbi:MAG: hypothetical protein ACI9T7_003406, partial [Oleiphilaceae bacterium]